MPTCECCWDAAGFRAMLRGVATADVYGELLHEHEVRGCVCKGDTLEGKKARAGQFSDPPRVEDEA